MTNMVEMYAKAYTEVYTIINTLDNNEKNKIPHEEIEYIKQHMDKMYSFSYDSKKSLKTNNVSREAATILLYLWKEYFLNKEKYAVLENILKKNEITAQEELSKKYSVDKIFNNNKNTEDCNEDYVSKNELVIYEVKWYQKIIDKIKRFFNKNN